MFDTNGDPIGMVLLVACLVGVIVSVIGNKNVHTFQEIAFIKTRKQL
jgi:hypothetical protein